MKSGLMRISVLLVALASLAGAVVFVTEPFSQQEAVAEGPPVRLEAVAEPEPVALVPLTPDEAVADLPLKALPDSRAEVQLSFAPIAKEAAPAVVNVYAKQVVQSRGPSPFMDDPFFRRFFGDPGRARPRERSSLGSGVIVDPSGVVVTNHHVIRGADEVRVAFADGREVEADITLLDERTDLAVLQIKDAPGPFPALPFADSDKLEVGDLVLAIGNPFGVGQTVTNGIVSALARNQIGITDYQFFIQTDAAINPGNSGGALVDMGGRLAGINTAIYSRTGASNGIGFAIPANMVRLVVESAVEGGVVRRPWFGAQLQRVTPDIAEGLGLTRPRGALVVGVTRGSPAAKAGLEPGDVITAVDGMEIADPDGFNYRFVTQGTEGRAVLALSRNGKPFQASIALMPPPEEPPRDERLIDGPSPVAGSAVVNLSPAVVEELGLEIPPEGVAVWSVTPRSPASYLGLRRGDVLRSINGEVVGSTRDLERLAANRERLWRIEVQRGGRVMSTVVRG